MSATWSLSLTLKHIWRRSPENWSHCVTRSDLLKLFLSLHMFTDYQFVLVSMSAIEREKPNTSQTEICSFYLLLISWLVCLWLWPLSGHLPSLFWGFLKFTFNNNIRKTAKSSFQQARAQNSPLNICFTCWEGKKKHFLDKKSQICPNDCFLQKMVNILQKVYIFLSYIALFFSNVWTY